MAYLGEEIKKLGFGLMRLPKNGEEFDHEQICKMVDRFLEEGYTYFDTAWAYAGSEDAIRKALIERHPREKFTIATKLAAWLNTTCREDAIAQFETSLRQTGAGYFDFYLLHNLGEHRTHFFEDYDIWNFAQEKKKEGLIKHVGFSFHGTPEDLNEILEKHPEAEFVQLQINYADWNSLNVQSRRCYEVVRAHNKPLVIMEPVKGGMLANPPQVVQDIFSAAKPEASFASWALHYAANLDGVITVLSGMSTLDQMEDNLANMKGFTKLSAEDQATIEQAQAEMAKIPLIQCTNCNYCAKVCPMGIGISNCFSAMNNFTMFGKEDAMLDTVNRLLARQGKEKPSQCIKCGACEEVCPQKLTIRDYLEDIAAKFER